MSHQTRMTGRLEVAEGLRGDLEISLTPSYPAASSEEARTGVATITRAQIREASKDGRYAETELLRVAGSDVYAVLGARRVSPEADLDIFLDEQRMISARSVLSGSQISYVQETRILYVRMQASYLCVGVFGDFAPWRFAKG